MTAHEHGPRSVANAQGAVAVGESPIRSWWASWTLDFERADESPTAARLSDRAASTSRSDRISPVGDSSNGFPAFVEIQLALNRRAREFGSVVRGLRGAPLRNAAQLGAGRLNADRRVLRILNLKEKTMKLSCTTILAAAVIAVGAAPAQATPITLNFSGTVNLSVPFGGPAASTFLGSVTWESTAAPVQSDATTATYAFTGATFSINGTDYSPRVQLAPTSTSFVKVFNDIDELHISFRFAPKLDVGAPATDIEFFLGELAGPNSMFSSTALPADLSFLNSVQAGVSFFPGVTAPPQGTFAGTAPTVPEPASLLLLASGLLGAGAKRWRRR